MDRKAFVFSGRLAICISLSLAASTEATRASLSLSWPRSLRPWRRLLLQLQVLAHMLPCVSRHLIPFYPIPTLTHSLIPVLSTSDDHLYTFTSSPLSGFVISLAKSQLLTRMNHLYALQSFKTELQSKVSNGPTNPCCTNPRQSSTEFVQ